MSYPVSSVFIKLSNAIRYADRIIGLAHGYVVFDGAPQGVTSDVLKQIYGDDSSQGALAA